MVRGALVTAGVAVVGALLAWRFLPARADDVDAVIDPGDELDLTAELVEA